MQPPPVHHAILVADRTVPFPPERVFRCLTDPGARARCAAAAGGWTRESPDDDVRPGGRERLALVAPDGTTHVHEISWADVVAERRLVFTATRRVGDRPASASVATIVLEPAGHGTRLVHSEQAAFLDGLDDVVTRKRQAAELLAAIQADLELTDASA